MRFLKTFAFAMAVRGIDVPFGMEDALTGATVPGDFLQDTYLTGLSPLFASRTDPRVSYTIFVPPEHYSPEPNAPKLPLLVDIHGTLRNISATYNERRIFASNTPCAILAPLFPAGLESVNDLDSYKVLRTPSLRSDLLLLEILDEVTYRWPGVDTKKMFMMGFSGGGQFAHRFLYIHPERLGGISIGAPGRSTNLNESAPWPQGIRDVPELFNRTVDTAAIGRVPIQLVIGEKDTETHGGEAFWEWQQETFGEGNGLPPMTESRLDSIHNLHDEWKKQGIEAQLDIVLGVGHDSQVPIMQSTVLGFLQPLLEKAGRATITE